MVSAYQKAQLAQSNAEHVAFVRSQWNPMDGAINLMSTDDLFLPVFTEARLARHELARHMVKFCIRAGAWYVRTEMADEVFKKEILEVTYQPVNGSWMTGGDNRDHESNGLEGTAPGMDRDIRDKLVVAHAGLAAALDLGFVPPSPTWIKDTIIKACSDVVEYKSAKVAMQREGLSAALEMLGDADQAAELLSSEFDQYKSGWLDLEEAITRLLRYMDVPQRMLKTLNPSDHLIPKDLIRPQLWAIGDPYAEKDKRWGAMYKAMKLGESGQLTLMLDAYPVLKKLEKELFPANEDMEQVLAMFISK
jgi:hypothetical protein